MKNIGTELYLATSEISRLKMAAETISCNKRECETKLASIRIRLKAPNAKINNKEFTQINKRAQRLRNKILQIERELIPLRNEIRDWTAVEQELQAIALTTSMQYPRPSQEQPNTHSTIKSLKILRDEYIDFSKDHTRVNSMRLMAGKFAGEISEIIRSELNKI